MKTIVKIIEDYEAGLIDKVKAIQLLREIGYSLTDCLTLLSPKWKECVDSYRRNV